MVLIFYRKQRSEIRNRLDQTTQTSRINDELFYEQVCLIAKLLPTTSSKISCTNRYPQKTRPKISRRWKLVVSLGTKAFVGSEIEIDQSLKIKN